MFINVEFKIDVIDIDPLFPKLWKVLNLKVLTSTVQRSTSGVQRPESRAQRPESSIQSSVSGVQGPESSVQSPTSRDQRPTLMSRVQKSRYAHLNVKLCTYALKTMHLRLKVLIQKSFSKYLKKANLDQLIKCSYKICQFEFCEFYLVCCNNFSENLIWCLVLICVLCRFVVLIKLKKHRGKKAREKLESKNTILVS